MVSLLISIRWRCNIAIAIISLITIVLKIAYEIFTEVLSDKAALKKLKENKLAREKEIYNIAQNAIMRLRNNIKEDSTQDMEDAMDKDING